MKHARDAVGRLHGEGDLAVESIERHPVLHEVGDTFRRLGGEEGLLPDSARSAELNIQCILAKPFTNEELGRVVRKVLDQAALADKEATWPAS